ncbi:type I-MYXAN CRISPR-associated endonuclease Cas4/Cas1 [Gloeobacter morelensis]|uniref:CRISPR-associated endonuclease Cas1 n=1 Tax=Gloeobacter morelensis MG652769 TaxID=2781736 RepID=A0ABY3PQR3_9CYAN|nr:type I-MYXAN CRISPR-associated endonuclease Cas1 [Gloeobacter morelensis]UFP95950.1 type I-MYXAN CRISPR-associated endonuclease Cas1 [Gloeobacter morelensis MG652769]
MLASDWLPPDPEEDTIRVSSLHALSYCPRLYYFEEVEGLRVADEAVYAGRRLHVELEKSDEGSWEELWLENESLGLRGRMDALRTRSGQVIPYEHKRGRCFRREDGTPDTWPSDRLQLLAYASLIEAERGITVVEGRVRYHEDNVTVRVPVDDQGRQQVRDAIRQARQLRRSAERPPVTDNERLCARCSLAPVCLPEEARLVSKTAWEPIRLFPPDDERRILHVLESGTRVGKAGEQIKITHRDGRTEVVPVRQVSQVVLHGFAQISTQALRFCAAHEVGLHYVSGGGRYLGSLAAGSGPVQRRIRQYRALVDSEFCLKLARKLVLCRGDMQRQILMRYSRKEGTEHDALKQAIQQMKALLAIVERADNPATLLGLEGNLAALYFQALPLTLVEGLPPELRFCGRNRRPPRDRVNALLSFGYALLLKDVMNGILTVGLEPAFGFYHQPRSSAPPLALDLMEIFRCLLVDLPILNSLNRQQWDVAADFTIAGEQVWLSDSGREKLIALYERRKTEQWKHPAIGYSLSYARIIELEVRLLEKEWMEGEAGLFAKLRLR